MILVTGATGNVGRNVIDQLISRGEKVRAIARDPGNAKLPDGVEVFQGDLRRPETLPAALAGVDRAFLFPVFGALDGFLDAAARAAVGHVVLLSSSSVTYPRLNRIGRMHVECEQAVTRSGLPWTFVRPGAFMTNDLTWAPMIRAEGVVRTAYGDAAVAGIDERDIAAVAVSALLDDGHAGQAYKLTGPESLTQVERVRILGEVIGGPVRFEEVPPERARQQMIDSSLPPEFADTVLEVLAALAGKTAEVLPTVEEVTGRPPYTYAQWAARHAGDFR
ncbi:SDR family oxidoreductase [Streptosporangium sp. CA-135522]|uniref:SDR family oxidoreductase n=1 Tax=Streptosporangium sp. CA-135522 TaxID=3240072 RepID=UPI003D8EC7C4